MPDATPVRRESHRQLEALVEQYGALIRRVIARVLGTRLPGLHEDIAQEVLINLWRQLDREQTIEYPASYIYRMAIREAGRALRQAMTHTVLSLEETGDSADFRAPASANPDDILAGRAEAARIAGALGSLSSERQRAVRAHLAGFSVTEIMEMNGWAYQKARNLIARGVADLRAQLKPGGDRG